MANIKLLQDWYVESNYQIKGVFKANSARKAVLILLAKHFTNAIKPRLWKVYEDGPNNTRIHIGYGYSNVWFRVGRIVWFNKEEK